MLLCLRNKGSLLKVQSCLPPYMELIARLDLPVLVVSRHYLGSINHTLLTIEALRAGAHYRQDPSTCRAPTGNYSLSCSAAEAILFNWSGSVNSSTPS